MHFPRVRIGVILLSLVVCGARVSSALAAGSPSYRLEENSQGGMTVGMSDHFRLEGVLGWIEEIPLRGININIVSRISPFAVTAASPAPPPTSHGGGGAPYVQYLPSSQQSIPSKETRGQPAKPFPPPSKGQGRPSRPPADLPAHRDGLKPVPSPVVLPSRRAPSKLPSRAGSLPAPSNAVTPKRAEPLRVRNLAPVRAQKLGPVRAQSIAPVRAQLPQRQRQAGIVRLGASLVAAAGGVLPATVWMTVMILSVAAVGRSIIQRRRSDRRRTHRRGRRRALASLLASLIVIVIFARNVPAQAAITVPPRHAYSGRLLGSNGVPLTATHSIRFSYWRIADALTSDLTGSGTINMMSQNYAGWSEVHTVTPDPSGSFAVQLGSLVPLPDLSMIPANALLSLYLQVEVKLSSAADTTYELLDPNLGDATIDRSPILSVPFARNADLLDQREIGTGSGSVPLLDAQGLLPVSMVPGGTKQDAFSIDVDGSGTGSVMLRFGQSLARTLSYSITQNRFEFGSSLRVQGDLTVTGLINGIDLRTLTGALRVFSGGGLNLRVAAGGYRLSGVVKNVDSMNVALPPNATNYVFFGSGGLTVRTNGFPLHQSSIPLAEVRTTNGSVLSIVDRRVLQSDDREQTLQHVYHPMFEHAAYQGDGGGDNVGQLFTSHDNIYLRNYYHWTTTRSTLQDYDIILRVAVPQDFVHWKSDAGTNPVSFAYRSTSSSTANNKLDVQVYDTNGTPVTLSGAVANLASTGWSIGDIEFIGSPIWTPGQDFLLRFKMSAKGGFQMHLGSVKLQTLELRRE